MKEIKIGNRIISDTSPAFVIAEAGINHNGELETAFQMIDTAVDAGVDVVKFQTFTAEGIMLKNADSAGHLQKASGDDEVFNFVKKISLSEEMHRELVDYCNSKNIMFMSTAGTPDGVDLLMRLGVSAFKIASMDLNNLPLLEYIASTGKPAIISTGMGTIAEIEAALEAFYRHNNSQVALLHCVALYPPDYEEVNLRVMDTLKQTFGVITGFSDHTVGNAVALAAVARGAKIIEKHFTLDKKMPGPDQAISADPRDLRDLVSDIRNIETALGSDVKKLNDRELEMRRKFRRSIVTVKDIKKGEVVTEDKLAFKRPGRGISPADLHWVLGHRAAKDIPADSLLLIEDLL